MTLWNHSITLAAFALSSLSTSVPADPPQTGIAVFSQQDPAFSETITLYADGKYRQSETQLRPVFPRPLFPALLQNPSRNGTWHLLDREGGLPIACKPSTGFPTGAVVELQGAMPFGLTWENQQPAQYHHNRLLPAGDFQVKPPLVKPAK